MNDKLRNTLVDLERDQRKKPQEGWVCPKCGQVNAPWVSQCPCSSNWEPYRPPYVPYPQPVWIDPYYPPYVITYTSDYNLRDK